MSIALVGSASHADVTDPNDARGPLDIRSVRMSAGDPSRWTFATWDSWRPAEIWDSGFLVVRFDTFGDSHFDYYALVRSDGNRLRGTLHRDYKRREDSVQQKLRVIRPSRSSARVTVPLGRMRFQQAGVFRWNARSTWANARCGEALCLDRAPDRGAVEEPRRPVPTPTITVTPTSSP